MITSVELDDDLFNQAFTLSGLKTKKAFMGELLRIYVLLHEQAQVKELRGKLVWKEDPLPCAGAEGAVQTVVDTSVWLAYFTGAESPEADLLDSLIAKSPLLVGDFILAEVLNALPDELHRKLAEEALLKFWLVEMGGFDVASRSAVNAHTLRGRGFEPGQAECLIATFCIERGCSLLHASEAFEPFEKLGLQVLKAA